MPPAISNTPPTVINAMTEGFPPVPRNGQYVQTRLSRVRLTSILAIIESKEQANNPSNNKHKPNEVEIRHMLAESSPLVRVEVQEPEQDDGCNPSSWPA